MSSRNNSIAIVDTDSERAIKLQNMLKTWGSESFVLKNDAALESALKSVEIVLLNIDEKEVLSIITNAKQKNISKIILLVATQNTHLIQDALKAGAQDYIVLPIRKHELLLRLNVMQQKNREYFTHGDFCFKRYPNQLLYHNKIIKLAAKEFELALLLFRHLDQPLSRAHIAQEIWQKDGNDLLRTIDTHISRVRTKLNLRPQEGYLLEHIYGFGYCLRFVATEKV